MSKVIVTDIEGTTTKISFVTDILFPYAVTKIETFVKENQELIKGLPDVYQKQNEFNEIDSYISFLQEQIEKDIKEPTLKTLQGYIWQQGYESGEIKGHLYQDAFDCFKKWHKDGYELAIYSSGSIKAQKLLFGHSIFGDLNPMFTNYFDLTTGSKKDVTSYQKIAEEFPEKELVFLSDVAAELDAAKAAGFKVLQLKREDNQSFLAGKHHIVKDFLEVDQLIQQ